MWYAPIIFLEVGHYAFYSCFPYSHDLKTRYDSCSTLMENMNIKEADV